MSEQPTKKTSVISSNQMLRNIHKSLRHLQLREQQNFSGIGGMNNFESQSQFEQQLAQGYNINALSQSAAGDRRSFPRANKAFALEEIRKDLQPFAWRNSAGSVPVSNKIKSSSITDLHLAIKEINNSVNSDKQKLSILVSYGYDEALAAEVIRKNSDKNVEYIAEILKQLSNPQPMLPCNYALSSTTSLSHPLNMYPQNQYDYLRFHQPYEKGSSHHNDLSPKGYTNKSPFETQSLPRKSSRDVEMRLPSYTDDFHKQNSLINDIHGKQLDPQNFQKSESKLKQQKDRSIYDNPIMRPIEVPRPKFDAVTLRQKNNDKKFILQNRWSADVLQNYDIPVDGLHNKPPPPYPGVKIISFPEKIVHTSSPEFDGEVVQFNSISNNNGFENGSLYQTSSEIIYSDHKNNSVIHTIPTNNCAVPVVPSDIQSNGRTHVRRSPPPYPGSILPKPNKRSSINIDEIENSVSLFKFNSIEEQKSEPILPSTTGSTERIDGVKRSYSPLPTCTNSPYHTMIIRKEDGIKVEEMGVDENKDTGSLRLKNYTPQACKFYLEQHFENLLKRQDERKIRREKLEAEMLRVGLPDQAQEEMRKLLIQKESNYIRLRRAKMDKTLFAKIKIIGVGAFGEVSLVRKIGTEAYYAMKTLKKSEVLRRNQVAHVKAERDILAEADNEWVVKLYYSFQDVNNLYFVMDYIPGGDLMALLIKLGVFEDKLARFYIGELVLAIESVHKLGFIHRDIKPDNVLIDKNGHIKLTDFGLCTGFRWTHDSKYYQPQEIGGHSRQFSMEPEGGWESLSNNCDCNSGQRLDYDLCKPLQRRKLRRHMRCQAHSLVGTPNYIAPEVLMRIPYSQQCDWWSVGVILFEMLIGQPPFFAHSAAETQMKIIRWRETLMIRRKIPRHSEDLILRLCSSPEERIGRNGANEIKNHPYFSGINFLTIHEEPAPHIPHIKNSTDTSNFDPVPEDATNGLETHEAQTEDSDDKKGPAAFAFYEFTFRHFFDDGGLANPVVSRKDQDPKPRALTKRSAAMNNNSISIPNKVPSVQHSLEDKAPVFV